MPRASKRAYDSLADVYEERMSDRHKSGWSSLVASCLAPHRAGCLLDLGCGAGDSTFPLADKAHAVVGVDNAYGMAAAARKRCSDMGIDNVHFVVADAEALPFISGSFDALVSRMTLHHTRVDVSLAEVRRVTAAGGKIVVVDVVNPKPHEKSLARYAGHVVLKSIRMLRNGRFRDAGRFIKLWTRPDWMRHMLVVNKKLSSAEFAAVCERVCPGSGIQELAKDRRLLTWTAPAAGAHRRAE